MDVSLDFGDCDISNVDVINEPSGKWVDKDKPKLEVTLEADDDYYFKSGLCEKNVTPEAVTVRRLLPSSARAMRNSGS